MGLADAYQSETDASISAMAAMPPEPPKVPAKWNGWSSVLRGPAAAVNEFAASASEVAVGTWRALREMDNQDAKTQHDQGGVKWNDENDFSKALRSGADYWRPDPVTASRAEQMVFDVSRFATKAVGYTLATGNPLAGAAALTTDEGMTTAEALKAQGVDPQTRQKIGMLSGVAAGAGVILPVSGSTWAQTIGLVGVGGPGAFVAQQQATKTILENANYGDLAQQYDPLDPWGLALSTLVPAGFGAWGMRGAAARRGVGVEPRPVVDGPNAVREPMAEPARPMEPARPSETVRPVEPMPRAAADETRIAPTQEHIDAALTHNLTLHADALESVKPGTTIDALYNGRMPDTQNAPGQLGDAKGADSGNSGTDYFSEEATLGRNATAIAKLFGAKKEGQGLAYGADGNRSRYYRLSDGRRLRVSDHTAKNMGSFSDADIVIDDSSVSITLNTPDQLKTKAISSDTAYLDLNGSGQQKNVGGEPISGWWAFDGDSAKLSSVLRQVAKRVVEGEKPSSAIDSVMSKSANSNEPSASVGSDVISSPENSAKQPIRVSSDTPLVSSEAIDRAPISQEQSAANAAQSLRSRITEIEQSAPDTVVGLNENGRSITARQFLEDVRREAREGTETELGSDDAPLLDAAANCFLATGAM